MKPLNRSTIHNILVITLSNIGDVVLTCPVIDILKEGFPQAKLSVVVGPKARSLFEGNPSFHRVFIFDKHQPVFQILPWLNNLRKEKFDLAVDLRNTAIPVLVGSRYRTPLRTKSVKGLHMKQKHLQRLGSVYPFSKESSQKSAIFVSQEDQAVINEIMDQKIGREKFVVMAPGAANQAKRWPEKSFAQVGDHLVQDKRLKIVFVGDQNDNVIAERIIALMKSPSINLCGKISLTQLAIVIQKSFMVISNDSAPMHLASYYDVPVVAVFGPSDPEKYGPWGKQGIYIKSPKHCLACQTPKKNLTHTCMGSVSSKDVINSFHKILANKR